MLEIRFLGKFEVRRDGKAIEIPSRKAQELLAYLALNPGKQYRREKIAGLLWPETAEASARSKLRYALWQLRKTIGNDYFRADRISLSLKEGTDYWLDVSVLETTHPERLSIEELREIVDLYGGELLPGFYEDWVILERERLQFLFEQRFEVFLRRLMEEGSWEDTLEWGERWISMGGVPEMAFRALMIAHSQLDDASSAANAYQRCVNMLSEQLGVEPSEETVKIYQVISQGQKPVSPSPTKRGDFIDAQVESFQLPAFLETGEKRPGKGKSIFVTRERELARLEEHLESVLTGQSRIVLIRGDAGRGKTALILEFSRRALQRHSDLIVTYGSGEAYTGIGDPHLLFRDVLALLTGDIENKWAKGVISQEGARRLWDLFPESMIALMDQGPELVGSFVSGDSLLGRAKAFTSKGGNWLGRLEMLVSTRQNRPTPINVQHSDIQKGLFEQYTQFLQKISRLHPILLLLDDLQWADLGSISLLFHLSRRIEGYPILIVGGYRPSDLLQDWQGKQHPLAQVLTEFKRNFGDIEIDLDKVGANEGRRFVNSLLDTEPNGLGEEFRQALYEHTGGHPLFTVELLRQMQVQGNLQKDEKGRWIQGSPLGWQALPARVEAVIGGRIDPLPAAMIDILRVASVEGEQFTVEIIAEVMGMDALKIVYQLSNVLDKRYFLVEAIGTEVVGGQRLSRYRFKHYLFQRYVYRSLDDVERAHLHEQVGISLERLYGDQATQVAVQLAKHFDEGGKIEKAVDYLIQAGEIAKRQSANEQAIIHLNKGLALLMTLPESAWRDSKELILQISLAPPMVATKGYTAPEVEGIYERARQLCEKSEDTSQLTTALWGLWSYYLVKANYPTARRLAEQIFTLSQKEEDPDLRLVSNWTLGITLVHLGQFFPARGHLEQAIKAYHPERHLHLTYHYGQNPAVTCLLYSGFNLWFLGYPERALGQVQKGLALADEIDHPYSKSFALGMAAVFYAYTHEAEAALLYSQLTIDLSKNAGFPFFLALGLIVRGWARSQLGKSSMTVGPIRRGIDAMDAIGAELGRPLFQCLLAEALLKSQKIDEGLDAVIQAIRIADKNKEYLNKSDLFRLKGELLDIRGETGSEVIAPIEQSITIAREQNAKSMELRGLMALSSVLERRGKPGEMLEQLGETYKWFSEGFETGDLKKARVLLGRD